jgi:hypothetical protein
MVLPQPALENRDPLSSDALGFGIAGLLLQFGTLSVEGTDGSHGLAAFLGQGGDRAQVVHGAAGIGRLPVVGTEGCFADRQHVPRRLGGLGELPRAPELVDGLLQGLDPLGILARQRFRGR